MAMGFSRATVISQPVWVVMFWVATACAMGFIAPDLTKLAAEGHANLLWRDAESLDAGARAKGRNKACRWVDFKIAELCENKKYRCYLGSELDNKYKDSQRERADAVGRLDEGQASSTTGGSSTSKPAWSNT